MTRYIALKQWIRETIKSRYGSEPTINPLIPSQDTNVTQHLVYDDVHHDYHATSNRCKIINTTTAIVCNVPPDDITAMLLTI